MVDTVIMPKLGFDMAEGTLVRWVIAEGSPIEKGAILAEIETDKATVEVESAYEGVVLRHLVKKGEVVPVNTPIALIGKVGEVIEGESIEKIPDLRKEDLARSSEEKLPEPESTPVALAQPGLPGGVRASPLARRIANEYGINLKQVMGSGPGGRVTKKDVEAYKSMPLPEPTTLQTPAPLPVEKPAVIPSQQVSVYLEAQPDEVIQIPRLRAAIGRRMSEAKAPVPHFYVTHEYNMDALIALRKQVNSYLPEAEKLSVNDFIVKAVALTLRKFLNLNATFQGNQITRFGSVNIGVAVAIENGLLTVVCKNADRKPIREIANEVRQMVERARQGKVRPEDIEGSTFSISNLGMFDVESFIAIINPPEAAILAVGSAREIPVIENGEIRPGWRMKATISVDHRISDGVEAAQFMQALAGYLEQPLSLLL